jgi:predicted nucleic-acid-binding Zn-ribbon protein
MAYVRKCEKCGAVDARQRWSSPSEAASEDAFSNWTCPSCAWTEFDLVEEAEVEAPAQATR